MWVKHVIETGYYNKGSKTFIVDIAIVILAHSTTSKQNNTVPSDIIIQPQEVITTVSSRSTNPTNTTVSKPANKNKCRFKAPSELKIEISQPIHKHKERHKKVD